MRNLRQPIQAGDAAGETNRSEIRRLASRLPWRIRQRDGADGEDIEFEFDGTAADSDHLGGVPAEDITELVSDGSAPASSPAPTVRGGPRYIAVTWPGIANADPVTYEVHVSDTTGFTPDATTLATSTRGTIAFVETLPQTDAALAYGVDYFVKIVATDADGAAAASSQASAELDPLGSDDILAGSVTAEKLAAVITLSTLFRTAASGGRLEWDNDGIRGYKSDGVTSWLEFNADGTDALVEAAVRALGIRFIGAEDGPGSELNAMSWWDVDDNLVCTLAGGLQAGVQPQILIVAGGSGDFAGEGATVALFSDPDDGTRGVWLQAGAGGYRNLLAGDSDRSGFVFNTLGNSYLGLEIATATVNIPSTAAHTSGGIDVSLPSANAGDSVMILGWDATGGAHRAFTYYARNPVQADGTVRVEYANTFASVQDPSSQTLYFLILHTTPA